MSDMAKVRELLSQAKNLTKNLEVARLIDEAVANSFREYVKPKSPHEAQKITLQLAEKILSDYSADSSQSCFQIGKKFNVNPGRVSELISGKHWIFQTLNKRKSDDGQPRF